MKHAGAPHRSQPPHTPGRPLRFDRQLPAGLAVLCDLDGTLIDSRASVVAAFRWWAEFRDLPPDTVERIPFGRTSTDAAAVLAPHLDAVEEGRLLDARQAQNTIGVEALPGARTLLVEHQRLAIVTSCPEGLARARLAAAGLPVPDVLLTPERWSRGKPDPEPYLCGMSALEANRKDCVVVEDAPSGVQSGLAAEMAVIAVLTSHTREELRGATAYATSLEDLPAIVAALGMGPAIHRS